MAMAMAMAGAMELATALAMAMAMALAMAMEMALAMDMDMAMALEMAVAMALPMAMALAGNVTKEEFIMSIVMGTHKVGQAIKVGATNHYVVIKGCHGSAANIAIVQGEANRDKVLESIHQCKNRGADEIN